MDPSMLNLKSIIPILFLSLFLGGSTFPHVPSEDLAGGVEIKMETTDSRLVALVRSIDFSEERNQIDIETVKPIQNVSFFNAYDEMIFTVPVGTSSLTIGVKQYPKGEYRMNFLLEDEEELLMTKVIKEF